MKNSPFTVISFVKYYYVLFSFPLYCPVHEIGHFSFHIFDILFWYHMLVNHLLNSSRVFAENELLSAFVNIFSSRPTIRSLKDFIASRCPSRTSEGIQLRHCQKFCSTSYKWLRCRAGLHSSPLFLAHILAICKCTKII